MGQGNKAFAESHNIEMMQLTESKVKSTEKLFSLCRVFSVKGIVLEC